MKCNDYIVWLSGHIDGTNSPREEQSLREHLKTCANCRALLEEMEKNDRSLKNLTLVPPERIKENVMSAVRKDSKNKKNRMKSYLFSSVAVAAVLCLVMIAAIRTPWKVEDSPVARSVDEPSLALMEDSEEIQMYGYSGDTSKDTRGVKIASDEADLLHCVFVELPSRDLIPSDLAPAAPEDFYTRVTREALDWYYYGGSIVYSSVYMTGAELENWESMTQTRFMQDDLESDSYVVVFCSESK